jgi:hypothetical protein
MPAMATSENEYMSWSAVQATAEKFSATGFLIQQTHVILMLFKNLVSHSPEHANLKLIPCT